MSLDQEVFKECDLFVSDLDPRLSREKKMYGDRRTASQVERTYLNVNCDYVPSVMKDGL